MAREGKAEQRKVAPGKAKHNQGRQSKQSKAKQFEARQSTAGVGKAKQCQERERSGNK